MKHDTRPYRRSRRPRLGPVMMAMTFAIVFTALGWAAAPMLSGEPAAAAPAPDLGTRFSLCDTGGGANCVVDGDTFRIGGTQIRIADIDTPETHPARCSREAELGAAATRRLRVLLNSGEIMLASADRDTDRYGRRLRIVSVEGVGVGDILVAEGLARRYAGGHRESWCG